MNEFLEHGPLMAALALAYGGVETAKAAIIRLSNGKNGKSHFTHDDRECLHRIEEEHDDTNGYLKEIRDDIKALSHHFTSNIPR